MATRSSSFLADYTQLNTIPAVSGILFAVSSGVQFLGASITLQYPAYTFPSEHAMLVSLGALLVAFASSDTKDWRYYDQWEQVLVALAVVLMIGAEYLTEISTLISNNNPTAGVLAFLITVAAWGVLAR